MWHDGVYRGHTAAGDLLGARAWLRCVLRGAMPGERLMIANPPTTREAAITFAVARRDALVRLGSRRFTFMEHEVLEDELQGSSLSPFVQGGPAFSIHRAAWIPGPQLRVYWNGRLAAEVLPEGVWCHGQAVPRASVVRVRAHQACWYGLGLERDDGSRVRLFRDHFVWSQLAPVSDATDVEFETDWVAELGRALAGALRVPFVDGRTCV
jgi:hypothetical protein